MQKFPLDAVVQNDENERLAIVQAARMLQSPTSDRLERLAKLASAHFRTPIALVSLLSAHRQWLIGNVGLPVSEISKHGTFCDVTVRLGQTVVIEDTHADPETANSVMVINEPWVRFYAGTPLLTTAGFILGTFCIAAPEPRTFSEDERAHLLTFGQLAMTEIDNQLGAGRRNEITNLPNRSQLAEDLSDLCRIEPSAKRSLVLIEIMESTEVQRAVRAVGIAPMERTLRGISKRFMDMVCLGARLYHVSETRFAILLVHGSLAEHLPEAEAMVKKIREPFDSNGVVVELQAFAGAVNFRLSDRQAGDALRCASAALYEAEKSELLVVWHRQELDAEYRTTYSLLRDLPIHLAQGRLRLVYQPKIDLNLDQCRGVEALLRWDHPELGSISPAVFIPLIEGTSLIHLVTSWVMKTGFSQQVQWQKDGLDLPVAINISARNLGSPGFLKSFQDACEFAGLPADRVHIECTETAMMTEKKVIETLRVLRSLGVDIALDDFGVGYSNLGALQDLPASLIKIDQSLVFQIAANAMAMRLFRSIVTMARSLGYRVLAEGVETEQVLALVTAAGCDAAQGYFLSRPINASEIEPFVRRYLLSPDRT